MNIKTVTVIGANGQMGAAVAAIFASFGNAKVYMISRFKEHSQNAVEKAVSSVRADSIRARLIAADYSMLQECVQSSDLVFESVAENYSVKKEITEEYGRYINANTVCCTGTSGLSIHTLSQSLPEEFRGNYFGVHFFNPPYNLTFCELVATKHSNEECKRSLKTYLQNVLLRTTVEVQDRAGFLGNRIGFQFMNSALCYAERYKKQGGIDYIDSILGPFTGRSMSPLLTSDFVGLDIHKAIVENIYEQIDDHAKETFVFPLFADRLVESGNFGKKTGAGLYRTVIEEGEKKRLVFDIQSMEYRDRKNYKFPFAIEMMENIESGAYEGAFLSLLNDNSIEARIGVEFLLKYCLYALVTAKEVSDDYYTADDAMATGFNWCPPLALLDLLSKLVNVEKLVADRIDAKYLTSLDIHTLLREIPSSQYDYRKFIRAKY